MEMVMVVTQLNIAEVPAFIAMSEELGADKINLRTLMPQTIRARDWTTTVCRRTCIGFCRAAGRGHQVGRAGAGRPSTEHSDEQWSADLYDRRAPLYCPSPYTAFYANGFDRRVIPCLYIHRVPGHEFMHLKLSMRFEEVWNSPGMVARRASLHQGPLMPMCLRSPFYC